MSGYLTFTIFLTTTLFNKVIYSQPNQTYTIIRELFVNKSYNNLITKFTFGDFNLWMERYLFLSKFECKFLYS